MEQIISWLESCGFSKASAELEAESMVRYHTTGRDAVSREYAIQMILEDIEEL